MWGKNETKMEETSLFAAVWQEDCQQVTYSAALQTSQFQSQANLSFTNTNLKLKPNLKTGDHTTPTSLQTALLLQFLTLLVALCLLAGHHFQLALSLPARQTITH